MMNIPGGMLLNLVEKTNAVTKSVGEINIKRLAYKAHEDGYLKRNQVDLVSYVYHKRVDLAHGHFQDNIEIGIETITALSILIAMYASGGYLRYNMEENYIKSGIHKHPDSVYIIHYNQYHVHIKDLMAEGLL